MRFVTRLRFFIGMVFIIALTAVLFLFLNYTMSNKSSDKATLETDSYAVTSTYEGVLKRQFVTPGQQVKEGDRLFEISSPALTQAIQKDEEDKKTPLFEVASNGNMILLATTAGVVQQVNLVNGSYVQRSGSLATIATEKARYVTARYLLKAPDYARINKDNPIQVTLPDNSRYQAKVFDTTLQQDGEQVYTVVKARLPEDAKILPTFTSGTPVSTSWQLNDSSWQEAVFRFVRGLVEPQTQKD